MSKLNSRIVISDVRFPNEAEMVRELGMLIRIKRDLVHTDDHESESYIDGLEVDAEISNNRTLEELHDKLERLLNQ